MKNYDERPEVVQLITNIKNNMPVLKEALERLQDEWTFEDYFYRFYHQSFKVYWMQKETKHVVKLLQSLLPGRELNKQFMQIVLEGTGKKFDQEHNKEWLVQTRPIVEACFHAKMFLELVVKYGDELERAPGVLPSGWAAVLYLYGLR